MDAPIDPPVPNLVWVALVGLLIAALLLALTPSVWADAHMHSRNAECRGLINTLRMGLEQQAADQGGHFPKDAAGWREEVLGPNGYPKLSWYERAQSRDLAPTQDPASSSSWGPARHPEDAPNRLQDHGAVAYRREADGKGYELSITLDRQGVAVGVGVLSRPL